MAPLEAVNPSRGGSLCCQEKPDSVSQVPTGEAMTVVSYLQTVIGGMSSYVIYLLLHLLTALATLLRPGGSRTIISENLLLKQQLIIHSRSRQRAPNLTTQDRTILGFLSLFLNPRRSSGPRVTWRTSSGLIRAIITTTDGHSIRDGDTPVSNKHGKVVDIASYRWEKHCRG
jgi:hypothetical protein